MESVLLNGQTIAIFISYFIIKTKLHFTIIYNQKINYKL